VEPLQRPVGERAACQQGFAAGDDGRVDGRVGGQGSQDVFGGDDVVAARLDGRQLLQRRPPGHGNRLTHVAALDQIHLLEVVEHPGDGRSRLVEVVHEVSDVRGPIREPVQQRRPLQEDPRIRGSRNDSDFWAQ
jgi:hypothetical protein